MALRATKVRLKDRRRLLSYVSISLSALLTLAVVGSIAYATRLPEVTIGSVEIRGAVHVDPAALTREVDAVLNGTYLLLVPKRMKYVVPKGAITAAVVAAFPTMASATVERTDQNTLVVTLVEREPAALWCRTNDCYVMDAYGFIFDVERPGAYRIYSGLVNSDGTVGAIGTTYLAGTFQDFDLLIDAVERVVGTRVSEIKLDEYDAFVVFEGGGELRFARNRAEELVTNLEALFSSNELRQRAFEYIELRFGPNATVKFKD